MWKANNVKDYPPFVAKQSPTNDKPTTRACTTGRLIEPGMKPLTLKTFLSDSIRLWNKAPTSVTDTKQYSQPNMKSNKQ